MPPSFQNNSFSSVSRTCDQVDVLMILSHVLFKQVDDGCQSRGVLQDWTDVSRRQRFGWKGRVLHVKVQELDLDRAPRSLGPPDGWTSRRLESSPLFFTLT